MSNQVKIAVNMADPNSLLKKNKKQNKKNKKTKQNKTKQNKNARTL